MRPALLALLLLLAMGDVFAQGRPRDTFFIASPSGAIRVKVWLDLYLQYTVDYDDRPLLGTSAIDLQLADGRGLSVDDAIRGHAIRRVNERIVSPVPEKRRIIPDIYNELTLRFRQPYTVIFRVYDDGVAYRLGLSFPDTVTIRNETAGFSFPGHPAGYLPLIHKREDVDIFHTSFEELYPQTPLDSLGVAAMAYSPVLVVPEAGPVVGIKGVRPVIGITESDLEDYPGMFLRGTGSPALQGVFAGYPLEEQVNPGEYPQAVVTRRADYIARVAGTRLLPWRGLLFAPQHKNPPAKDVFFRPSSPSPGAGPASGGPGSGTAEWGT